MLFTFNQIVKFLNFYFSIVNFILICVNFESGSLNDVLILFLILFKSVSEFIYSFLLILVNHMLFSNLLMAFLNFLSGILKPLLRFFFWLNFSRESYFSIMKARISLSYQSHSSCISLSTILRFVCCSTYGRTFD